MDDLISRQAAIEAFDGAKVDEQDCTEYDIGYNDGIDFAVSRLSVLPSAQQWMPCSKGLPKKDGDYYVTTHDGQITRLLFIKGLSEEYWMQCATAWMPLPEPYKGEP